MDQLSFSLDDSDGPLFLRIARAIARDVGRGRFRPGDKLPGSRTLAETLGVHRNTVLAAFRELESQGWIEALPARGTRVSTTLPERAPKRVEAQRSRDPHAIAFELTRAPPSVIAPLAPPGVIALLGGLPDLQRVPMQALARAYRRACTGPRASEALGYGDPRGEACLRDALAGLLSHARGLAVAGDDVVVTRGSQMAIALAARAVLSPGDVVLVEALGYRPAWEALRAAGAVLRPIRVDQNGVDVAEMRAACERERVRAVYVTPHHQYPTTVLLSSSRRLELLALAARFRLAVFEDDYDHEFHYDGRPVLPLASADVHGSVIYFGTLSKILAPALRVGFVVAPRPLLDRLVSHRALCDRQGDRIVERALTELIDDGELVRHARRMRRLYEARRAVLVRALTERLGNVLTFTVPPGGMALWARARGVDVDEWARVCAARGVAFQTARRFTFDGKRQPFVRLGFAAESEARLEEAVSRMVAAVRACRRAPR